MDIGFRSGLKLISIPLNSAGGIVLHNSERNSSRNHSGIALTIETHRSLVIFSGDFEYSQISNSILSRIGRQLDHYFVVPHHGGKAGIFQYAAIAGSHQKDAIISVGTNNYRPRHPQASYINNLTNVGFNVVRTDIINSDYVTVI